MSRPYDQIPPEDRPDWGKEPSAPAARSSSTPAGGPSIVDAFGWAWQAFKSAPGPWLVGVLVVLVIGSVGRSLSLSLGGPPTELAPLGTSTVSSTAVDLLTSVLLYAVVVSMVGVALRSADGYAVSIGDLTRAPNLGHGVLASVIMAILTSIGLALLLIPGLVVAVLGIFYAQAAVDSRVNAIKAIGESFRLVSRNLGPCLVLVAASVGVTVLGTLALLVGLLVAIPLVLLATTYVYRRLVNRPVQVPGSAGPATI